MIVCTNCGNHNEDTDEFCGSCGKFLEWVGERVEAPAAPAAPEVEEEADPVKVGFVDRVKAAVGIDEASRPVDAPVAVGVGGAGGAGSLAAEPEVDPDAELQRAAEEAAAAEAARQEAEAEEAARRAQVAQEEAQARAASEAEAARAAEDEARRQRAAEAEAVAAAVRMRRAQEEAEAKQRDEELARASAEAEAAAATEASRLGQIEAEREANTAAEREAAEAEALRLRQEEAEKAAAFEAAKRAEEAARAAAEAEASARAEADTKAREEAEAARAAEEEARRRSEDEARAVAAAEARAREEEEARKRAAALLARPKAPVAPAAPSGPDPFVDDPATTVAGSASSTAMTPAAAAAAAAAHAQRPTAQTPVAQQPTTVKQPPRPDPKVTAVEQAIQPGDLVCSQCGSGNDPARKFCRKCGNSLAAAVVAAKVPWWKRIFGGKKSGGRVSKDAREKQRRKQKATDASFKAQMAMANFKKAAMFLMMIGVLGSFAVPSVRGEVLRRGKSGFTSVQDTFNPQISPVNAIAVAATSSVPGKEANLAADLVVNTFWAEGAEGDGVGQTISFTFAEPTDLTKVLITAGDTDTPENYVNNPRPKGLHLVFDTGGSADLNLIDAEFRKSQSFGLKGAKGVTKVDIVVSSVYPGRGGTETGIAEVEFKKKG